MSEGLILFCGLVLIWVSGVMAGLALRRQEREEQEMPPTTFHEPGDF